MRKYLRKSLGQVIDGLARSVEAGLQHQRRHLKSLAHQTEPLVVTFDSWHHAHVRLVPVKISVRLKDIFLLNKCFNVCVISLYCCRNCRNFIINSNTYMGSKNHSIYIIRLYSKIFLKC